MSAHRQPGCTGADGPRFVIFLGGLQSHSLETEDDHRLRDDFAPLRRRLLAADPSLSPIFFSYGAGGLLQAGRDPSQAWHAAGHDRGEEAIYSAVDTTDRPLADHVAGLAWLAGDLLRRHPTARLDLIGFSLGGIVALAWAAGTTRDDPALEAVHRIVLVSCPVGGITRLGRLTPTPGVRQALGHYRIEFGRSLIFRALSTTSPAMATLGRATRRVDVASVENSRDYVVNGKRITGQVVLPTWVRTITLGRGAAVSAFLPPDQCYVADLGGWDRHLRTTHHQILRGATPAVERAHGEIVGLVLEDGPMWTARRLGAQDREAEPATLRREATYPSSAQLARVLPTAARAGRDESRGHGLPGLHYPTSRRRDAQARTPDGGARR